MVVSNQEKPIHADAKAKVTLMKAQIIRLAILVALAVVLSTVFAVDNFLWQGTITGKYFWFAAAMCFSVALWVVVSLLKLPAKVHCRSTDLWVLLLAVYILVNYWVLNGWPNMHWWLFLLMIPLYVMVRTTAGDEQMKRWLPALVLMVSLVESVWGLAQLYGFSYSYHGLYKMTGSLFNPGPYSGVVAVGAPLALGYALDKTLSKWERWLGIVTLATTLLVLPAAMSRAAWLAVLAGCAAVLWKWIRTPGVIFHIPHSIFHIQGWRRVSAIVATCVLAVALLAGVYLMKKDSADGRWLMWRASMEAVKERPLFGAGYGRFTAVYGDAQAAYFLSGKGTAAQVMVADSPDYAFNEYVQMAVELGLAGLILFLSMIGFGGLLRSRSLSSCYSPLITLLVFAAFSYPFSVLPLGILFVFLLALQASSSKTVSIALPVWLRVAGLIFCLCFTAYGAYQVLSKRTAYREWTSSQLFYQAGAYKEATKAYRALYPSLRHEKTFLFEYGQCLSKTEQYDESNRTFEQYLHYGSDPMVYNCMGNNDKATGAYQQAENAYIRASQIVPNRHYPLYQLMKLYQETGQADRAQAMAKTLLEKPVKVKSTAIREMQEEAREVRVKNEE